MVLLDTCFVVDVLRSKPDAVDHLGNLLVNTEPMVVSSATVLELHHGISRSERPAAEHRLVESVLNDLSISGMDTAIAANAGRLRGESMNGGAPIPLIDCIIAATALELREPLLTRDDKHFANIEGLVL